jgi:RNA polymerase sigma factor (sigma-70 family)
LTKKETIKNIEISYQNIEKIFLDNQDVLSLIVNDYIYKGLFPGNEKQDIIQSIHERLLNNKKRIVKQFKGDSSFRTYLYVVVRNICLHIARDKKKELAFDNKIHEKHTSFHPMDTLIIEEEIKRFDRCLGIFCRQRAKLEFCLKLKFRIPITNDEFSNLFPLVNNNIYKEIFQHIEKYHSMTDNMLFDKAIDLLNRSHVKKITANSLIKWTKRKIDDLINLMNGNIKRANYSDETLQILAEKYFDKKDKKNKHISEYHIL